jgi:FAD synthetase
LTKKKQKVVLASGAFDLVHYGHVYFLKEAKKAGGQNARLIVIIARDTTIKQLKGKSPVIPENQRRAVIEALKPVDEALLGYENRSLNDTIQKLQPSIIAVGYDQEKLTQEVTEIIVKLGLDIQIVKIDRFSASELSSSSKIKRKILNEWK